MGEWGVEVPANLTWIKIHSFISSVRMENGRQFLQITTLSEIGKKIEETVFFVAGLTDTFTEKFRPKDVKEFI